MPQVTIIGAGIAGLAAALRLIERGFDVTLLEQHQFLGGKLAAHQDVPGGDFHEHSYHLYLNWYHNFWRIADEIGVRDRFEARHVMAYLQRGAGDWRARMTRAVDVGAPDTALTNLMNGPRSPADMFIYGYSLVDLLASPESKSAKLDQMSVLGFFNSRPYMTDSAMSLQDDLLLKAFACPSFLTAVTSFRSFIGFGYQCPSPMMWLLRGNTQTQLFAPFERHLRRIATDGPGSGQFDLRRLHRVTKLRLNDAGAISMIEGVRLAHAPDQTDPPVIGQFHLPVAGDVILAIPPGNVSSLVDVAIFDRAPGLANVRQLHSQPMCSLDLYFKRRFDLPVEPVDLLNSRFKLSFLDTSRLWHGNHGVPPFINVVASDARAIFQYDVDVIRRLIIEELRQYLPFTMDDIDLERSVVHPNAMEELFINEVGSWDLRPATTCGVPNLFMAGDYCQNPIDVVTIEGAVVSGLLAAEAVRARARVGHPVEIIHPKTTPDWQLAATKMAYLPYAYAAHAMSTTKQWWDGFYREMFPKG